jgi:hypothetical protein
MMMCVEQVVEWEQAGETGENLSQCYFVHHNWLDLTSKPDRRCGTPATKRLSYGTDLSHFTD